MEKILKQNLNQTAERMLRRTALVLPPRGRAVLCVWAAAPGCFLAPFVFWRSLAAGAAFCALWAALVAWVWVRACSFVAALGEHGVTVWVGLTFPVRRTLPRQAVIETRAVRTPLLRCAGCTLAVLYAPGAKLVLPAVPAAQAETLLAVLAPDTEDRP